ncbi:bacteriophage phiKZ, Orf197 [Kipferlia bialata]|uniref:Bacteriophage phiKZ, Orf197 n=1 Tax=Kipferlia bialata TaxID=797122 RepID=A0A9K3GF19_9EUKA|nr:bacteriophage phiKZ, Orf197 [Kipferlia bialata]|eukprot:g1227.t1
MFCFAYFSNSSPFSLQEEVCCGEDVTKHAFSVACTGPLFCALWCLLYRSSVLTHYCSLEPIYALLILSLPCTAVEYLTHWGIDVTKTRIRKKHDIKRGHGCLIPLHVTDQFLHMSVITGCCVFSVQYTMYRYTPCDV